MVPHTPAAATNRMPCLQSPPSVLPCQLGDASDALSPVLNSPFCGAYKAPRTISHLPLASSPLTFLCHCPKPYFPTILNSQINFPHISLPTEPSYQRFLWLSPNPHSELCRLVPIAGRQSSGTSFPLPVGLVSLRGAHPPALNQPSIYMSAACIDPYFHSTIPMLQSGSKSLYFYAPLE